MATVCNTQHQTMSSTTMSMPSTDPVSVSKSNIKIKSVRQIKKVKPYVEQPSMEQVVMNMPKEHDTQCVQDLLDEMIHREELKPDTVPDVLSHLGDYIEEPKQILQSYFGSQHLERLVRHQLESYNHFITCQIMKTIEMFNPLVIHSEDDFNPEYGKYSLEINLSFENFKLMPPQIHENNGATKTMFPHEARLRNFTYASTMIVDVHVKYLIRNTSDLESIRIIDKVFPKINIGKIPIMVKSAVCVLTQNKHLSHEITKECPFDCGGYFIIKGQEKTVLGQERADENKVHCFDGKNTTKWDWFAEIKSIPDSKCISPKQIEMYIASKNNGFGQPLYIQIPRIKQPVELFVVFRAMGIVSDKDICSYILLNIDEKIHSETVNFLQGSIVDANQYMTQEDAFNYLVSLVSYTPNHIDREAGIIKKRDFAEEILKNDLFPHCKTRPQKLYLLGYMAKKLIQTCLGYLPPDDRDSYLNKRIELTGSLINNLFRNYVNKMCKEIQKQVIKEINTGSWNSTEDYESIITTSNIYKIIKSTTIESGINRALATGDFSVKQSNSSKVGVAQILSRLTYASSLSHARRINTPLEKSGELIEPRKLHNTVWGFLCPVETPEGQSIGVVKNISYMTHITIPSKSDLIYRIVKNYIQPIEEKEPHELYDKVKVIVNGAWLGITDNPIQLYTDMKEHKYRGTINIYTSIVFDYKLMEIRICNDAGRLTRPVLRVKNNKVLITKDIIQKLYANELCWNDLLLSQCKLEDSVIEYIDPEEQNFANIAMKEKNKMLRDSEICNYYTHCEIHPSTIFGILASCVPFPEHNQAPRNTYQCAMAKQAMGVYVLNYNHRMDKTSYVLAYPTRPLVDTQVMNFIQMYKIPSGMQVHVAIMSYTGYNQEDSILVSEGAIQRGLFGTIVYHTEKDEDKNIVRDEIIRCNPDKTKTKGHKFGNYDKLNSDGFIPENSLVENRDIIISKIIPIKENRNNPMEKIKYEDQSKMFRTTEETYIDKNYTGRNGDGYNFAKVRTRTYRKPVIGDKFSSRHGQKGTCGNIIPERDMPYTKDGLRPDIIINPHAIPSRMTIAHLKETLLGKILIHLGMFGDGTSFGNLDIKTITEELQKTGYESYGNEVMYDGLTGKQLEANIFIGPIFYQRLKHMVADKQHSRANGPMVNLTRQPAEGRCRDGGFRIGEMERDVLISHGAVDFMKDRYMHASDSYVAYVCNKCGMLGSAYNDGCKNKKLSQSLSMQIYHCKTCDNTTDFSKANIPYAFKLLYQELQTINVVPRLIMA